MQTVGPVKIVGPVVDAEVMVPLATFEKPLWPSAQRGARVTEQAGGISAVIIDDRMTRSIVVETHDAESAARAMASIVSRRDELAAVTKTTSRFARLLDVHTQCVANLIYLRLEFSTGDAAGHNMVTLAADRIMSWLLTKYTELRYVSISGNFCTDKKISAVNGILGRGKNVVCDITIPHALCRRYLKTEPQRIVDLNIKKNFVGTMIAGGVRTANAHFANILLAFYLATGQDAANIIEGSQGITYASVEDSDLYFSATLPNIIVGSVGSGKDLAFVEANLEMLGCREKGLPGENARRLAAIAAAAVLCGELSLLAAQTNPGELMAAHTRLERESRK